MKHISLRRAQQIVILSVASAAAAAAIVLGSGKPAVAQGAGGFTETDTAPFVDFPTPGHASLVRMHRQPDMRRIPHYVNGGTDVVASFVPYGSRWIVSGGSAHVPSLGQVVTCFTTSDTMGVATLSGSIQSVCAAIDESGSTFHASSAAGAWVRDVCADGTVLFTVSPDPFTPNRDDPLGKGCDATRWDGSTWSTATASLCGCDQLEGQPCSDPCFVDPGTVDASGQCQIPENAEPFCPLGLICNGNPDPTQRCD